MTERPILFSAPMVRAILAGTKMQTRRVVKPFGNDDDFVLQDYGDGWWPYRSDDGESPLKDGNEIPHTCPYGQPGDRLWVRETWAVPHRYDHLGPSNIPVLGVNVHYAASEDRGGLRWRPSIHMCRWASRITLEVTDVRVERLGDISEADALAEGVHKPAGSQFWTADPRGSSLPGETPTWAFRNLWESINGPGAWDANPWVWVLTFRRIEGTP